MTAILLNILKDIWWMNIFGLMDQCDTKIDLIKNMQINDLYFVVQWFCLTSWLSTVNYFDKLNNGTGRGYSCTSTCSSFTFFSPNILICFGEYKIRKSCNKNVFSTTVLIPFLPILNKKSIKMHRSLIFFFRWTDFLQTSKSGEKNV